MRKPMTFEAWKDSDGIALVTAGSRAGLGSDAVFLYSVDAYSWEEAMAIHHLGQGFELYRAERDPEPCPQGCATHYYPDGSGICPL